VGRIKGNASPSELIERALDREVAAIHVVCRSSSSSRYRGLVRRNLVRCQPRIGRARFPWVRWRPRRLVRMNWRNAGNCGPPARRPGLRPSILRMPAGRQRSQGKRVTRRALAILQFRRDGALELAGRAAPGSAGAPVGSPMDTCAPVHRDDPVQGSNRSPGRDLGLRRHSPSPHPLRPAAYPGGAARRTPLDSRQPHAYPTRQLMAEKIRRCL